MVKVLIGKTLIPLDDEEAKWIVCKKAIISLVPRSCLKEVTKQGLIKPDDDASAKKAIANEEQHDC